MPLLLDVRLHNRSQLAGFAKRDDLAFFAEVAAGMRYREERLLAPTEEMLAAYRAKAMTWDAYGKAYTALLAERDVANRLAAGDFRDGVVLLCSEAEPVRCHRRIAAEYLERAWPDV